VKPPLLSVADARDLVLKDARPLPAERRELAECMGGVLTEDVRSLRTQPPADLSAMDGYAVRSADVANTPVTLDVIGESAAGHPLDKGLQSGQAARLFTGSVVPDGADTIIIQENTTRDGDRVTVRKPETAGRHIRRAGLDFEQGAVLLPRGHRLSERDLMLAAAMNHPTLPVHRRPKVAVLATGDELVPPGSTPGPGEIVYSNGFAIVAFARSEGAEAIDLGVVPDRLDETVAAIRRARDSGADILVTTGGASVGDYDLVQKALASEGLDLSFWKVALRPGRPLMHGTLGGMHVLGLPGNPVSSFVCSLLFLAPLIRCMAGRTDLELRTETARLGCDLPANDERSDYMRSLLSSDSDGSPIATPFPIQDSSMMAALAQAGCLVVRDPFEPAAKAGDPCVIVRLTPGF